MSMVISAADSSGTPTAAYCGACRATWHRPPDDLYADTLPAFAVDHLEHLEGGTAARATAARICQLVAEGGTLEAHRLADSGTAERRAELGAALAEVVATLAIEVDGGASVTFVHAECAPPHESRLDGASWVDPATAAGVVDLARVAVDLAGRYLYLEHGTDPDDRAAIAAFFAEGVAYESTDPEP